MESARTPPSWVVTAFRRMCAGVVARLPWGLDRVVAPTMVGFALLSSVTFAVDLSVLMVLHGVLGVALPVAVTVGYVCAFALGYVLNRVLNFASHAPMGGQVVEYVLAVAVNYAVFIVGVSTGLAALGVDYRLARLAAGACEAVFLYSALRWVVFRPRRGVDRVQEPDPEAAGPPRT